MIPLTFSLLNKCQPTISGAVPTINLTDDELAAVTAEIRRAIEGDRYPHAPRLDPLRAALGKLEAARSNFPKEKQIDAELKQAPIAKASPAGKDDKGARSAKAPAPKISPGFKLGRLPPDR
jgi:hypothetical protein